MRCEAQGEAGEEIRCDQMTHLGEEAPGGEAHLREEAPGTNLPSIAKLRLSFAGASTNSI